MSGHILVGIFRQAAYVLSASLLASAASADTIAYHFSARLDTASPEFSYFFGERITADLMIDANALDQVPIDPAVGLYEKLTGTVSIGSTITFPVTMDWPESSVRMTNGMYINFTMTPPQPISFGAGVGIASVYAGFYWPSAYFTGDSLSATTDVSIPSTCVQQPYQSACPLNGVFGVNGTGSAGDIFGVLDTYSATVIPIPMSCLFSPTALAMLMWVRRRTRL